MIFTNLDILCRRWLLERGLPIHWYSEALFHASTAVRELSFDTLKIINVQALAVNDYGAIDLPDDFVDDISVCIPAGNQLVDIPKNDKLSPIRVHDATGAYVPYSTNQTQLSDSINNTIMGFPGSWGWYWNVNEYGEPTGRFWGSKGGTSQGYKLIKERRQIQLTDNFIGSSVVLLYISDGQSANNASQIDTMAISCIQSYIDWKRSPNAAIKNSQEAATFYNEKRLLRARLSDVTMVEIKNIIHNAYSATIKN